MQKSLDDWFQDSPNPGDIAVTYHHRSGSQADISIASEYWATELVHAPGALCNAGWLFCTSTPFVVASRGIPRRGACLCNIQAPTSSTPAATSPSLPSPTSSTPAAANPSLPSPTTSTPAATDASPQPPTSPKAQTSFPLTVSVCQGCWCAMADGVQLLTVAGSFYSAGLPRQ